MGTIQAWCTKASGWLKSIRLPYHLQVGRRAERVALRYLCKQGLQLLDRNFACRAGEIDLIMLDAETLIFVEVRLRVDNSARESVTWAKQQRIIKAARNYLTKNPLYLELPCRFDIIGMQEARSDKIEWIQHAFEANL